MKRPFGILACVMAGYTLALITTITPCAVAQHKLEIQVGGIIICLQFSPNSKLLAASDSRNLIRVWNLKKKEIQCVLDGHVTPPRFVAYPDNDTLVTVFYNRKETNLPITAFFFDLNTGLRKKELDVAGNPLALSQNGRFLVARDTEKRETVLVHDLFKKVTIRLQGHEKPIELAAISENNSLVAAMSETRTLKVWRIPQGEMLWEKTVAKHTEHLVFARKSQLLTSFTSGAGDYQFWNSKDGKEMHRQLYSVHVGAVSPDGKWIVSGFWNRGSKNETGMQFVSVENAQSLSRIMMKKDADGGIWQPAYPIAISPDRRFVAAIGTKTFPVQNPASGVSTFRVFEVPELLRR